jgi:hypothetical protein
MFCNVVRQLSEFDGAGLNESCAWLPIAPSAGFRSNMGLRASCAIGIKLRK